ncbi:MAG: succinate--CoA ligase subunit alpha [Fibrobacteria bacterium]|nr:succinate--CoA ligase subunit alpha [Fibrobacteria bacterium]
MSQLLNCSTRIMVQGLTGKSGRLHGLNCLKYGSRIVGGVVPGKGGSFVDSIPVFNSAEECINKTGAEATLVFVPALHTIEAVHEAVDAGIKLVVIITEGIPVHDMSWLKVYLQKKSCICIGPNSPGIATAGEAKMGIIPGEILKKGNVGIVSRSGTLTYEAIMQTTNAGLGQSMVIGVGGDPVHGMSIKEAVHLLEKDITTEGIIVIGEPGGGDEEEAARYIEQHVDKPVVGFIAGVNAPEGKRMGHAGALFFGHKGSCAAKIKALQGAGITIAENYEVIADTLMKKMSV